MSNKHASIAFASVGFAGGALLLVTQDWTVSLDGNVAAWVQAIGTLIALCIAIAVPWHIHSREAAARKSEIYSQGKAVATVVRPCLIKMRIQLEQRLIETKKNLEQPLPEKPIVPAMMPIDNILLEQIDKFWMIGLVGDRILRLVSGLQSINNFIIETEENMRAHPIPESQQRALLVRTCGYIQQCMDQTDSALSELQILSGTQT